MKQLIPSFLKTSSVALLLSTQAHAGLIEWDFGYTGTVETWVVGTTGTYTISAIGAQGGDGQVSRDTYVGGLGAKIQGSFNLTAGDLFYIAVGGQGSSVADNYNGGGGGGTFFVSSFDDPILIAGGGGGIRAHSNQNGCDASISGFATTGSGSNSSGGCILKTTDLGLGGIVGAGTYGSGGGGFNGNGEDDASFGLGGSSWFNDLVSVTHTYGSSCTGTGGFGGGGIGGCGGGSGGGGYSGGDGGFIAGGGGSYNSGYDQLAMAGIGYGNGSFTISYDDSTAVPEPATFALFALGLAGMGFRSQLRKG